jgi:PAS domain-containing protein
MGMPSNDGLPTQQQNEVDLSAMLGMDMDMDLSLEGADANNAAGFAAFSHAQMQPNRAASSTTSEAGGAYPSAQEMMMTGAGAGPLPTGFGAPSMNPSGSTLTEFTKRRNWSQRVLEELRDLLHILTPDGRILYVSPSCKALTGWDPSQLMGRFINEFIHPDDIGIFVKEFNESIASGNPLRFFYRFRKIDDAWPPASEQRPELVCAAECAQLSRLLPHGAAVPHQERRPPRLFPRTQNRKRAADKADSGLEARGAGRE